MNPILFYVSEPPPVGIDIAALVTLGVLLLVSGAWWARWHR